MSAARGNDGDAILKRPIVRHGTSRTTMSAVCVELSCRTVDGTLKSVSTGTGFLHRREGQWYFITNWHVVTRRNPAKPSETLYKQPEGSPVAWRLHLPLKSNPLHVIPTRWGALYREDQPQWIETSVQQEGLVDLVALPFDLPEGADARAVVDIAEFSPDGTDNLYVGRELAIVGFPFGITPTTPFAVWKRAFVASEPSIAIDGMPRYLADSPGRPGMSGSPVFMLSAGTNLPPDLAAFVQAPDSKTALDALSKVSAESFEAAKDTLIPSFAGVYSGSVGIEKMDDLQLGVVWHAQLVDRLFSHPKPGHNPYPPFIL